MAEYLIKGSTLTEIANAIRAVTGSSASISPADFATAIRGIQSGGVGRPEGEFLKYLVYQLDDDKMEIIIYGVLWQTLYRDKGNYNISIPDNFGPYQVVIASEGVM